MKARRIFIGLLILPLSGCNVPGKTLVIPTVDVENLEISLPALPTYNQGAIRSDENYEYIDMYEVSDFHGAVDYEEHSDRTYLGLKKLGGYLDSKRENNKGGTLLLSCGDMFQGSADSNLTRGYMVNYSMHYLGFDAMAVGNHEFDWNEEWLKKNAELKYNDHTIPYLGANIVKGTGIPEYLQKSTIINRGEYKIGVIGVIGSKLEDSILKSAIEGFEFVSYGDIVSEEANRLKTEEGCHAVVLLAHDQADALESVNNVDGIFGGHAHKNYNLISSGVPTIATENYGSAVAHMAFKFDKATKTFAGVEDKYGFERFNASAKSISDNSNIANIMNQYSGEISKIKDIKLGKTKEKLDAKKAIKNICTESMYDAAYSFAQTVSDIDESKIIAAFTNVEGGIRADIEPGNITYGDVYKCFPFDNEIVLFKETGATLISKIKKTGGLGCYRTIEDIHSLDYNTEYYIATTDFLALGDQLDAIRNLTDEDLIRTGKVVRDEVAAKIYNLKKVSNKKYTEYNIKFTNFPGL